MFSCAAKGAYGPPARPPPPLADDDTPPQNPCRRWRRRRRPIAPGRPTTFAPCFFTATRRTEARGEGLLCGGSLSPPRPRPFTTATSLPGRSSQPCWGSTRKNGFFFLLLLLFFFLVRTRLLKRPPPLEGIGEETGSQKSGASRERCRGGEEGVKAPPKAARSNASLCPLQPSLPSLPSFPPSPPSPPSPPFPSLPSFRLFFGFCLFRYSCAAGPRNVEALFLLPLGLIAGAWLWTPTLFTPRGLRWAALCKDAEGWRRWMDSRDMTSPAASWESW